MKLISSSLSLFLSFFLLACTAPMDAELEQEYAGDKSDVSKTTKTVTGFVAFRGINDRIGAGTPSLQMPQGRVELYSFFGDSKGFVDMDQYAALEAEDRGRRIWGSCNKVTRIANPLHNSAIGFATWVCEVTLMEFEIVITGDLYVLGQHEMLKEGELEVGHWFGTPEDRDGDLQVFRIHKAVSLTQLDSQGEMQVVEASLAPGDAVVIDRSSDSIKIHTGISDADDGQLKVIFFRIDPRTFNRVHIN